MATLNSLREKTSVAGDDLLYLDDSATAIGSTYDAKIKWSTLKNDIDAFDIYDDVDTLATPASSDRFIFADVSETGNPPRYTTLSGLKTALGAGAIDIHATVSTAATPADVDRFIFSDESETNDVTRYVTFANFKTALGITSFDPSNSGSTGQYLVKTSTGYNWATLPAYPTGFSPSNSGSTGQYLVKTSTGYNWATLPSYPTGFDPSNTGVTGQYLVKTASGYNWATLPTIPTGFTPSNTGTIGQHLVKTATGYSWQTSAAGSSFEGYYDIVRSASDVPGTGTLGDVLFIAADISSLTGKAPFKSASETALTSLAQYSWFKGTNVPAQLEFDDGVVAAQVHGDAYLGGIRSNGEAVYVVRDLSGSTRNYYKVLTDGAFGGLMGIDDRGGIRVGAYGIVAFRSNGTLVGLGVAYSGNTLEGRYAYTLSASNVKTRTAYPSGETQLVTPIDSGGTYGVLFQGRDTSKYMGLEPHFTQG